MKNGIHTNWKLLDWRKELRNNATKEEQELWKHLKGKKLGFKFQRQHSVGPYIADFYCAQKKLIIELDGKQHLENKEYDAERTRYLETLGFNVIRFWNDQINNDLINVLKEIKKSLN